MHLSDLKNLHVTELVEMANSNEIENANRMRKQDLIFALLKNQAKKGESIFGEGVLEILQDGFGFLRAPEYNYLPGPDDIYVSPSQIKKFGLRTGDTIEGHIPAADVKTLLARKPAGVVGLTIPGMPASAPGIAGHREERDDCYATCRRRVSCRWGRYRDW